MIATADTRARRRFAVELGADVAIDSEPDGLYDRLLEVNDGCPVDVVPAPSGGSVFEQSLDALAPFGRLDGYAAESATVDPVGLIGGSRAVIGFWLGDCLARPEMVARALSELMGLTSAGRLLRWPATSTRCHRQVVRTRTCSPGAVGTLLLDPSR